MGITSIGQIEVNIRGIAGRRRFSLARLTAPIQTTIETAPKGDRVVGVKVKADVKGSIVQALRAVADDLEQG